MFFFKLFSTWSNCQGESTKSWEQKEFWNQNMKSETYLMIFWRAFICWKLSQAWDWTFKGLPPIVVIWDHETNSKIYLCYLTTYYHQGLVTYCEFLHIKPHYPSIIQFYEHQTRQGSDLLCEAPTLEALFFDHVTNVEVMWQTGKKMYLNIHKAYGYQTWQSTDVRQEFENSNI